jgi:RNA polymerase sigma factor (sigma-70 family)
VYAIVRNTCIDYYRLDAAMESVDAAAVELADPGPAPDAELLVRQERRLACRVLLALPRKCRQLWRMIFFGKLAYRDAAERLGVAEGSVKRQMWECRQIAQQLREDFENQAATAWTKRMRKSGS